MQRLRANQTSIEKWKIRYISDTVPALAAVWTDDGSDIDEGDDFWTAALKAHQYLIPTPA